ncbi:pyrroline-5-carboxylate reductase [Aurantibacter sp.]|uniref:pyrroline-5-carboxylate reductase n=1 Tax=Aurantibacter sp. TaxID=2807103 RepID=UPI0035C7E356
MEKKITIIGGGNLGQSIANGLLNNNYKPSSITITRNKIELLNDFKARNVTVLSNNPDAVKEAEVIIIAVKPHSVDKIIKEINPFLDSETIFISVVSGYSLENIKDHLNNNVTNIFRAMPNTATEVLESMTCISHTESSSSEATKIVTSIFDTLGKTTFISDELMDAATVLGACGIAYALRFIRAMMQGGIEIGFDAKTANLIATQTVKGASELLIKNQNHPEAEIDKVTTPKGCTIAGLNEMENKGFSAALIKGIKTSFNKLD